MSDQKQFICCASKKVAILRCPRCSHLSGNCRNCATQFNDLSQPNAGLALTPGSAITCNNCQFNFPTNLDKHLAVQRDLVEAGIRLILTDEIELKAGPREETPTENYRHKMDRIGWDGKEIQRSRSTDFTPTKEKTHPVVMLLAVALLAGGLYTGYYFFGDLIFPPPPPPKPPAKGKKPGARPATPTAARPATGPK